jgi:ribose 5-phosphate isomerase B
VSLRGAPSRGEGRRGNPLFEAIATPSLALLGTARNDDVRSGLRNPMIVAVACDHAGFPLKPAILDAVRSAGHEPLDLGTDSEAPVDYPDNAVAVGRAIQEKRAARGILICGSGVGAAVAANKMRGIRAGVCHDLYSARQSVEHDDANVLSLGARVIDAKLAAALVQTFLAAQFSDEERHRRRLAKIKAIEDEQGRER